jgi:hypothetical protein
MAIVDDIRTKITTDLASYTAFKVSSELPFDSNGIPLYAKNMKTVYVDDAEESKVQLYRTLDQGEVYQTETTVNAFLCVDAKNQPSDIDTVIANILGARDAITGTQSNESSVTSEIEDDVITYTFEYNITKIS